MSDAAATARALVTLAAGTYRGAGDPELLELVASEVVDGGDVAAVLVEVTRLAVVCLEVTRKATGWRGELTAMWERCAPVLAAADDRLGR